MKNTAIVLAGGRGSRMQSDIPKQYMDIEGRTVLFYSLKQFQHYHLQYVLLLFYLKKFFLKFH